MTREQAKKLWSIIKAYADGEDIEVWSDANEAWIPMGHSRFNEDLKYRVVGQNGCAPKIDYNSKTSYEKEEDDLYTKHLKKQRKWEFQPYDRVVVRNKSSEWGVDLFSHYDNDWEFPYVCIGGCWKECLPYNEQTKELLGSMKDFIR